MTRGRGSGGVALAGQQASPAGVLIVAIARMSREPAKAGDLEGRRRRGGGEGEQTAPGDCPALIYGSQQNSWHSHGLQPQLRHAVCRSLPSLSLLGVCRHVACKLSPAMCVRVLLCVCVRVFACLNVYLNRPVLAHHFVGCHF